MSYARGTSTSVERSMLEIEKMVRAAGATQFFRGSEETRAIVGFALGDRRIQFEASPAKRVRRYGTRPTSTRDRLEQAHRERWRALVLTIKAKLLSVEAGIETVDEAFLAQVVVPSPGGGATTFGKVALPAVAQAYKSAKLPQLLPSGVA